MSKRWLCAIALLLMGLGAQTWAQSWPDKPIKVIVPYSPGSATDIIPRTIFAKVQEQLGQPIVVENRPGASSTIGTAAVAKAEPDGYTILVASSGYTIVPSTVANLPYDPLRDLVAVTPLANMANVLVVSPNKAIKTVGEFVAEGKARHGSMNYVTIGEGSAAHLNSVRFLRAAGFDAQPIPYKGSPAGLTDVMTGRVDFYFCPLLPALSLIRDGKLTALAVSSTQRSPKLPDVPTTTQAGFPNSEYNFWFGSLRARQDSARHHPAALSGDRKGAARPRRAAEAGEPRRPANADDAGAVRCLCPQRAGAKRGAGKGGRYQSPIAASVFERAPPCPARRGRTRDRP